MNGNSQQASDPVNADKFVTSCQKIMKILMLNYEFPPIGGGAGKAHLCLLKEYAGKNGLTIDVLTSSPQPGFTTTQFTENITIYKVGIRKKNLHYWRRSEVLEWLFRAGSRYCRMIKSGGYDLVHAFFGFPTGLLCWKTKRKLPYIISLRGSDVPGYNVRLGMDYLILAPIFRKIWKSASLVIANSSGLAELAGKFTPHIDIPVISNGIYTGRFYPANDTSLHQPIRVLTVGRLISRKRIDLLIKATAVAKTIDFDVELSIAGDGNLTEELKKLAADFDVSERVKFLGRIPAEDMPQVYREHDIFLMSSLHEGMSNAMLEAMASSLPIVTTRCEGVDELVANNGIVVDRADAKSIVDAIKTLAEDKQLYEQMCAAAREQAKNFTWTAVANKYLDCYHEVINQESE